MIGRDVDLAEEPFSGLSQLTELHIQVWYNAVIGSALCALTGLEVLGLEIFSDDQAVDVPRTLSNMPRLKQLSINMRGNQSMFIPSAAFSGLTRLTSISMSVWLDEALFLALGSLPKLSNAAIFGFDGSNAPLTSCVILLTAVTSLTLGGYEWGTLADATMEGCLPKLRYLDINSCYVTEKNLHLLKEIERRLPGLRRARIN